MATCLARAWAQGLACCLAQLLTAVFWMLRSPQHREPEPEQPQRDVAAVGTAGCSATWSGPLYTTPGSQQGHGLAGSLVRLRRLPIYQTLLPLWLWRGCGGHSPFTQNTHVPTQSQEGGLVTAHPEQPWGERHCGGDGRNRTGASHGAREPGRAPAAGHCLPWGHRGEHARLCQECQGKSDHLNRLLDRDQGSHGVPRASQTGFLRAGFGPQRLCLQGAFPGAPGTVTSLHGTRGSKPGVSTFTFPQRHPKTSHLQWSPLLLLAEPMRQPRELSRCPVPRLSTPLETEVGRACPLPRKRLLIRVGLRRRTGGCCGYIDPTLS